MRNTSRQLSNRSHFLGLQKLAVRLLKALIERIEILERLDQGALVLLVLRNITKQDDRAGTVLRLRSRTADSSTSSGLPSLRHNTSSMKYKTPPLSSQDSGLFVFRIDTAVPPGGLEKTMQLLTKKLINTTQHELGCAIGTGDSPLRIQTETPSVMECSTSAEKAFGKERIGAFISIPVKQVHVGVRPSPENHGWLPAAERLLEHRMHRCHQLLEGRRIGVVDTRIP